jgi:hypothetical protein
MQVIVVHVDWSCLIASTEISLPPWPPIAFAMFQIILVSWTLKARVLLEPVVTDSEKTRLASFVLRQVEHSLTSINDDSRSKSVESLLISSVEAVFCIINPFKWPSSATKSDRPSRGVISLMIRSKMARSSSRRAWSVEVEAIPSEYYLKQYESTKNEAVLTDGQTSRG